MVNPPPPNTYQHSYGTLPTENIEEGATDDESDSQEEKHTQSFLIDLPPTVWNDELAVISNTINSLLGVSLFAMPWGFQQSGLLGGTVVLAIVAYLSYETACMLLVSQNTCYSRYGTVFSYPEIAAVTLGPLWSQVIQVATILSCLGGCTGYLIFFGETVGQALSIPANHIILISTVPLILLSWIRSFRELTVFALIGVGALVLTVMVLLVDGWQHMHASPSSTSYATDPLHADPLTHPSHSSIPLFTPNTICNFMGPATFLFTIHYIILSMGGEALQQRGWSTYHSPPLPLGHAPPPLVNSIGISYFVSLVIIVLVGGSGFVMYRNVLQVTDSAGQPLTGCEHHICQNVILNLSPGLPRNCVGVAMSVVIILSYILILAPAREHIEREAVSFFKPSTSFMDGFLRNFLRTFLVLMTVFVAIQAPYFGSVMGAVGGLTDALQCFVFPPLIHLALNEGGWGGWGGKIMGDRGFAGLVVSVGVGVVMYTCVNIASNVWDTRG